MQFDMISGLRWICSSAKTPNQRKTVHQKRGLPPPLNWIYTNSILKHGIEHSRFFVPAKLSEARRTGGTRERNDAKPGRKRCCANDMV